MTSSPPAQPESSLSSWSDSTLGFGVIGPIACVLAAGYLPPVRWVFQTLGLQDAQIWLGLSFTPFVPLYACVQLTRLAVEDVASDGPERVEAGLARVEQLGVLVWGSTVWDAYWHLDDPDLRARLQQAFERATGDELWDYAPVD